MAIAALVEGQFDDAIDPNEILESAPDFNPREGQAFIDEQDPLLQWSEPESEPSTHESDGFEEELPDDFQVGDEDWEIAEKGWPRSIQLCSYGSQVNL